MSYPNNITSANCRFITDNRLYVQGLAGANSYAVAPGTVVQLMDNEGPYFYIKSADINGVIQPLRRFKYEEDPIVQPEKHTENPEYVTKEDFEKKFDEMMAAIANINKPRFNNYRKGDRDNESRND